MTIELTWNEWPKDIRIPQDLTIYVYGMDERFNYQPYLTGTLHGEKCYIKISDKMLKQIG